MSDTSDLDKPRLSGRRKSAESEILVKSIVIIDAFTGIKLYERIAKWNEKSNTSNLGFLIKSFYQLAREIDDGEIKSVSFESKNWKHSKPGKVARSRSGTSEREKSGKTMKMVCSRSEEVVVSIFYNSDSHSVTDETMETKMTSLVDHIRHRFQTVCGTALFTLKPKLIQLASSSISTDNSVELAAICEQFTYQFYNEELLCQSEYFPGVSVSSMSRLHIDSVDHSCASRLSGSSIAGGSEVSEREREREKECIDERSSGKIIDELNANDSEKDMNQI